MSKINYISIPFDGNAERKGCAKAPSFLYKYLRERFSDIEYAEKFKGKTNSDLEKFTSEVAKNPKIKKPFFIGGNHVISFSIFKSLIQTNPKLDFIYLDAHFDADDIKLFNSSVVKHSYNLSKPIILNIGSREKYQKDKPKFIDTVPAMQFSEKSLLKKLSKFKNPVHLSIDADVLEPAIMPGVSHPEAFGLTPRELHDSLKVIFAKCNVVSVDLAEFNPTVEKKYSLETFASIVNLVSQFWR
ncbi:MAG: arginase family protein [Candidatus Diapherotrites archaeon]